MTDYFKQYKRNEKAKARPAKGTPQPGEIWWVSNLDGIKDRPVLILGHSGNMYQYRKCTSQLSGTRERAIIEDYIEAGLEKETYVDAEIRTIERSKLVRRLGELSDYDRERFGLRASQLFAPNTSPPTP